MNLSIRLIFKQMASSEFISNAVSKVAIGITIFDEKHLHKFQPHDDCRKLLWLTILFLDGTLPKDISFKAPARLH